MYIRWKRYVLRRTADVTLKAFLVDSVRVAGRPRQRILGYLGAIRERYQQAPAHRQHFWSQVAPRLHPGRAAHGAGAPGCDAGRSQDPSCPRNGIIATRGARHPERRSRWNSA